MKTFIAAALAALFLTSCTSSTPYGKCIGAFDEQDPTLRYHPSVWNIFLGIFFIETIVIPAYVVIEDTQCPVGRKATPNGP